MMGLLSAGGSQFCCWLVLTADGTLSVVHVLVSTAMAGIVQVCVGQGPGEEDGGCSVCQQGWHSPATMH